MDRIINITVNGSYLTKDGKNGGVQYEANSRYLRITFDKSWEQLAKKVTFWNAKGLNPVERTLTMDLMEDISTPNIYVVPIPGEALTEAGYYTFVIDGYIDGKRQRTVGDKLECRPSPYIPNAAQPADPTPTQAEQLQVQIDAVITDIQRAIAVADTADEARQTAQMAQQIAETAESAANDAASAAQAAAEAADKASESVKEAQDAFENNPHASKHAANGSDPIAPGMIGAVAIEQQVPDGVSLNTITFSGFYRLNVTHANMPSGCEYGQLLVVRGGLDTIVQMCFSFSNEMYVRAGNPPDVGGVGAWSAWKRMLCAGEDPSAVNAAQSSSIYNIDEIAPTGLYRVAGAGGTFPPGCEQGTGTLIVVFWDGNYSDQIYISYHTFRMYRRRRNGAQWEPWYLIHDAFTFTKGTTDIGEGAAMTPGSWYAVYE